MSVLSRALCVGAISVLAGCAVGTSSDIGNQELIDVSQVAHVEGEEAATAPDTVAADFENDSSEFREQAAPNSGAILDRRTLLSAAEAGYDIELEKGSGFTRVLVSTGAKDPVFDVFSIQNPPRLVLDMLGEQGGKNKSLPVADDTFLKGVRIGNHSDRARIVFDLTDFAAQGDVVNHSIDSKDSHLVVTFVDQRQADAVAQANAEPTVIGRASEEARENERVQLASANPEEAVTNEASTTADATESAGANSNAEGSSLNSITFTKGKGTSGEVVLGLTDEAPYVLKQTNPSEYVLTLAGVTAASRTKLPQIAPPGTPGIRTVRAVQEGNDTLVRMFVDPGIDLRANMKGTDIHLVADEGVLARHRNARAQLEPTEGGEAATPPPAAAPAATEEPKAAESEVARMPEGTVRAADGSRVYTGRLISLDLQDTDIDNALRIIAEVSNLNIIASDDVTGKVTLRLIDVPWDQALDVILKTNGLDQVQEGNVIRIAPLEKLRQERLAKKEADEALEALEKLDVSYIRVSYARVTDLKEQVESVLSERGNVTVDERTNQLVIKDIKRGQDDVYELIKKLDLRTPQVLLETQIVEAQRSLLRDLGFQWGILASQSPETGNATGLNFPNSITIGGSSPGLLDLPGGDAAATAVNFPAAITENEGSAITALLGSADGSRALALRLTALETEGRVKVISRPQVATVNNKQAEIKSVETVRVRLPDSGLSVATGSGASASGGGSSAFEEIDVGIELSVTPQASPDFYVLLDIEAKSSLFGSTQVDNIPSTIERQATSTILVKSGQTFALGGVYRILNDNNIVGVPFLKDIPVLGHLFRKSEVDNRDEELIFFITPHIVEGSFDPSLM